MIDSVEYDSCRMSKASFNRITSHLRKSDIKDSIELDLMEKDPDVCKW